jgi:hypothetical protein
MIALNPRYQQVERNHSWVDGLLIGVEVLPKGAPIPGLIPGIGWR